MIPVINHVFVLQRMHGSLLFIRLIRIPYKVKQTMYGYPQHLILKILCVLPGIFLYLIQTDEDVALYLNGRSIMESNDIGIIIVIEILAVQLQNLLIIGVDDVDVPGLLFLLLYNGKG